ncbi:hypothetical protein NF867_09385, partial [Solitalea sp. MAHUQ-68]
KGLINERVSKGNKILDAAFYSFFLLGLILLIWEIYIYRQTIIDVKIPLLIWTVPGVFLTPLLYDKLNNIDGRVGHWILHYIGHTCSTGAILLFGFMASNLYMADYKKVNKQYSIIEKGSIPGSKGHRNERLPYVVINYEGLKKELIFSYSQTDIINTANNVNLTVRKGFWGFDVLEEYEAN